ncbi:hypothetical protein DM860_014238 [Cuscuta australis]|uniref:Transmembrane protein n=1 Tax=Cuscuta australis TaxID=267555 RepID=A0A328DDF0_9ASTE|nr:hypothetical protein DM860_014238 [Cuscuta australis]
MTSSFQFNQRQNQIGVALFNYAFCYFCCANANNESGCNGRRGWQIAATERDLGWVVLLIATGGTCVVVVVAVSNSGCPANVGYRRAVLRVEKK